jgi:creatinine amidohydrolase
MEVKVLMEEMSWQEIEDAMKKGKTTVILVSGSVEQHGPHLPTGTDTLLGYAVAEKAARRLGTALVAPVIRPALSEHHLGFPGSFTLTWETYFEVLRDCCESLARHGFRDIILTSSHGGNTAVMRAVAPDIGRDLVGRVKVHVLDYIQKGSEAQRPVLESEKISRGKAGVHAGYGETSEMLAAKPGLVRMEAVERGLDKESFYDPSHISRSQIDSFILGIKHFSENGILGDPRGANRESGERLFEIMVHGLASAISDAVGSSHTAPAL